MIKRIIILWCISMYFCINLYSQNSNRIFTHDKESNFAFDSLSNNLIEDEVKDNSKFSIGVGGGLDFFILPNATYQVGVFLINKPKYKLSIGNEVSAKFLFVVAILGDYPYAKIQTKLGRSWWSCSLGPEFSRFYSLDEYEDNFNYRVDIGRKLYIQDNISIELSIPVRFFNEYPYPLPSGLKVQTNITL